MRKTPLTRRTPLRSSRDPRPAVPQYEPEVRTREEQIEARDRARARRAAEKQARLAAMTPEARAAYQARLDAVQARRAERAERRKKHEDAVAHKAWNRARHATWERDNHRCVRCAVYLPMTDVAELDRPQCHHRKLRSRGGALLDLSNLIMLCARCHDWCHKNVKEATKAGWIVPRNEDPACRPVRCATRGLILLDNDGDYALAA